MWTVEGSPLPPVQQRHATAFTNLTPASDAARHGAVRAQHNSGRAASARGRRQRERHRAVDAARELYSVKRARRIRARGSSTLATSSSSRTAAPCCGGALRTRGTRSCRDRDSRSPGTPGPTGSLCPARGRGVHHRAIRPGTLGVQVDGDVALYVDLVIGDDDPNNAYWQAYTNGGGGTIVSFDEPGRLYYTLSNGTVH